MPPAESPALAAARVLAVGALLATASCAPGPPPTVEVGTGVLAFESVPDGADLPIICGSQGGQHIWTSVRAVGAGTRLRSLSIRIERPDGTRVCGQNFPPIGLIPDGDAASLTGLICFIADPAAIDGQTLRLHAELEDEWWRRASDARTIVARAPNPPCE